jgi:putative ABC transport system permease protein
VEASRGIITDRNGKVLVSNRLTYTLIFSAKDFENDQDLNAAILRLTDLCTENDTVWNDTLPLSKAAPYSYTDAQDSEGFALFLKNKSIPYSKLSQVTPTLQPDRFMAKLRELFKIDSSYTDDQARTIAGVRYELAVKSLTDAQYVFADDVSVELISQTADGQYQGVSTGTSSARVYNTEYAAHVLGRLSPIYYEDWVGDPENGVTGYRDMEGYSMNSLVGREGAEKAFESYLHGTKGTRIITTNEEGKITGELYTKEPQPGGTVALTLDIDVQEDTLSSYPVTIEAESADMSGMVTALMGVHSEEAGKTHTDGRVYASNVMYDLMQSLNENGTQTNDLEAFKRYLDNPDSEIHQYLTSIQYAYDLSLPVYTKDADNNIVKADVMELLQNMMSSMYGGDYSSYFSQFGSYYSAMDVWEELLPDEDGTGISPLLKSQYDVLYGRWPESYDEVVLVVGENNEISDLVMYAMGLKTEQEMTDAMQAAMNQETIEKSDASWSYEELCGHTFQLILPFEHYAQNADGSWADLSQSEAGMEYLYGSDEVGTTLKIVGVLRPDPDAANSMVRGSLGYTSALTQYVLDAASESAVIRQQLDDPETDVLTGLPFKTGDEEAPDAAQMREAVGAVLSDADTQEKAQMYADMSKQAPGEYLDSAVQQAMDGMTRETIEAQMTDSYAGQMGTDPETVRGYIAQMDDETLFDYVAQMLREQIAAQYAEAVSAQLAGLSSEQLAAAMDAAELTDEQVQYLYDTSVPAAYSDSTLEDTLSALGYVERSKPSKVNLYASTFSDKDAIGDCIERYNDALPEDDQITYTDYVALLMSSVTTIINAISYVLIAFVSISLVVSSIMIGIITYISVLERTKEIGILRAIGASKHDIARVFNAETLIEGLIAGLLGVGLTLVLILPINAVVQHLTDIASLGAKLPWQAGAALVAISMLLTFLAGLIPSSLAAKKDPVVALRTE